MNDIFAPMPPMESLESRIARQVARDYPQHRAQRPYLLGRPVSYATSYSHARESGGKAGRAGHVKPRSTRFRFCAIGPYPLQALEA